ncbi:MAG: FAD-binding oxidoreductase [Bauldia sp.]|nr:FAD-binding oxidoreductase [Bauldia sp.]
MTQEHAPSLYAAQADPTLAFPRLEADERADVVIVGGGYTGLSAALHLAERGVDVVLLEAGRIGCGASGRNGGQLHSGQRRDQGWLEAKFGRERAHALWDMAQEAKALVLDLIRKHGIDAKFRPGLIEPVHKARLAGKAKADVQRLREEYRYGEIEWMEREALAAAISTDVYHGAKRDRGAGHLDPLAFAQGLARAAAKAGARLHEESAVTALAENGQPRAITGRGVVSADVVILAGDAELSGIEKRVEARVMPIKNYIVTTEPIGAGRPGGIIPGGEAVSDSRFVVHYWRPSADARLVFGGGETYTRKDPADIRGLVRRHLLATYPALAEARLDYAWGGSVGITWHRLPLVRRLRPGVYTAGGYSGQGVALAPYAGMLLAEAIAGDTGRFDRFAALPAPPFPGGKLLRPAALIAGMTWYALRDRI